MDEMRSQLSLGNDVVGATKVLASFELLLPRPGPQRRMKTSRDMYCTTTSGIRERNERTDREQCINVRIKFLQPVCGISRNDVHLKTPDSTLNPSTQPDIHAHLPHRALLLTQPLLSAIIATTAPEEGALLLLHRLARHVERARIARPTTHVQPACTRRRLRIQPIATHDRPWGLLRS